MKRARSRIRTIVSGIGLTVPLIVAASCSTPPPSRESLADPWKVRLTAMKIESAATALYLSDPSTYDAILEVLSRSLDRFETGDRKYDESQPGRPTPEDVDAGWDGVATIRLLVVNLEIAAHESYRQDPTRFDDAVAILEDALSEIVAKTVCDCPPSAPFCCCGVCRMTRCEIGECVDRPVPINGGP